MTLTSRVFGRAKLVSAVCPVEPLTQRVVHHVYSPRWQPTFVAKFILYSLAVEVRPNVDDAAGGSLSTQQIKSNE